MAKQFDKIYINNDCGIGSYNVDNVQQDYRIKNYISQIKADITNLKNDKLDKNELTLRLSDIDRDIKTFSDAEALRVIEFNGIESDYNVATTNLNGAIVTGQSLNDTLTQSNTDATNTKNTLEIDISNANTLHDNLSNDINIVNNQLNYLVNIDNVSAVSNIFTFDLANKAIKNFKIETLDTVSKTIAFANVASNVLVQMSLKLKYTNACTINYPASVKWQNGVIPTFTLGKVYFLQFISDDGGLNWYASSIGAW